MMSRAPARDIGLEIVLMAGMADGDSGTCSVTNLANVSSSSLLIVIRAVASFADTQDPRSTAIVAKRHGVEVSGGLGATLWGCFFTQSLTHIAQYD